MSPRSGRMIPCDRVVRHPRLGRGLPTDSTIPLFRRLWWGPPFLRLPHPLADEAQLFGGNGILFLEGGCNRLFGRGHRLGRSTGGRGREGFSRFLPDRCQPEQELTNNQEPDFRVGGACLRFDEPLPPFAGVHAAGESEPRHSLAKRDLQRPVQRGTPAERVGVSGPL